MSVLPLIIWVCVLLPATLPALMALLRTAPRHARHEGWIRNAWVRRGLLVFILILSVVFVAFLLFRASGCEHGFGRAAECDFAPLTIGQALHDVWFLGAMWLRMLGLPALACYALAEVISRYRLSGAEES